MSRNFIIAIDLGGTNLKVAVLNTKYKILDKQSLSTKCFKNKENLISALVHSVNKVIENNNLKKSDILGIGLGLPGPVDKKLGIAHFFPNIPGFREVNLKNILQKKINLPVFLDNDAKLMCLAEYNFGRGQGLNNILCLTLGTGVGGGIILHKRLYRGANNAAGEIGHIPINEKGPLCNCGGNACLEAYIGNSRISRRAKLKFKRDISLEELSVLAKEGNKRALGIWLEVGRHLGIALSGIVNLLNLDAVIIGGGVANSGKILFDKVQETLRQRAMSVQARHVKIFKAKLGTDAGLVGAAVMVKEASKQ